MIDWNEFELPPFGNCLPGDDGITRICSFQGNLSTPDGAWGFSDPDSKIIVLIGKEAGTASLTIHNKIFLDNAQAFISFIVDGNITIDKDVGRTPEALTVWSWGALTGFM